VAAVTVVPYTTEHISPVRDFNSRLLERGVHVQLPEAPTAVELQSPVYEESYLAIQGSFVRGGFSLRYFPFSTHSGLRRMAVIRMPISEGIIEPRYSRVGLILIHGALRISPELLAVGMGGRNTPIAHIVASSGWTLLEVPFYFRVVHPSRFFSGIRFLRGTKTRRSLFDFLSVSGLGRIGVTVLQARPRTSRQAGVTCQIREEFGPWADQIWTNAGPAYGLTVVRNSGTLQSLYPAGDPRFMKLQICRDNRPIGWAVILDSVMSDHKQFGDLRVGSIADCFALPDDAQAVIDVATDFLEERGVDLIVSNQLHQAWRSALSRRGYVCGPSNFAFATSRTVACERIPAAAIHVNRGDGDGPVNL
jgi:hypothetical protein